MKQVKQWQRVEPTIVTKIDYRNVVVKTFIMPDTDRKRTIATFMSEGTRCAGVIALTPDRQVILSRQFRPGPERLMNEIPGGGVEAHEDPEVGSRRELLEETGYEPGHIEFLGVNSRDAYTNGEWFYYLATDCTLSAKGPLNDEDEQIEVMLVSIADFLEIAKHDGMSDPAAALMAYDKLIALQKV